MKLDMLRRLFIIRSKCSCTFWRTVVILILLTVAWNEYLSFIWARFSWSQLPQTGNGEVKILFVADPQLQGYNVQYETFPSLINLAVWDADSYLANGFTEAYSYLKPDVVVFLGDLIDEGSTAIDLDYKSYVKRFYHIYATDQHVKKVYIWGDNDVGGEGIDFKTEEKVTRFIEAFQQSDGKNGQNEWRLQNINDIDFVKVDQDWGQSLYKLKEESLQNIVKSSKAKYIILVNHMTILYNLSPQIMQKLITLTKPNLIVSSHTHYAQIIECGDCYTFDVNSGFGPQKKNITAVKGGKIYSINLLDSKKVTEIMVPTCSYRMGVKNIGYGAAVIGGNIYSTEVHCNGIRFIGIV